VDRGKVNCARESRHRSSFHKRIDFGVLLNTFFKFKLSGCQGVEPVLLRKVQACRQHALGTSLVRNWLEQYRTKGEDAFDVADWRAAGQSPEARMRALKAAVGRSYLEIKLLKDFDMKPLGASLGLNVTGGRRIIE